MYQSQPFHTSNYRGNQQGHDSYLRADSQSPSAYGTQNVTSQYRGMQKTFQPTGPVTSVYGQQSGFNPQQTGGFSSFGTSTSAQSYHTSNYRGDQQGHDSYLRADSRQPAQSQFGGASGLGMSNFSTSNNFNTGFSNAGVSSYSQNQGQFVSPESYHTANYRGSQEGHDSYLRGDSSQPSQSQFGIGASGTTFGHVGTSSYNNVNANIGTSSFGGTGSFGASGMGVSSFGTSNYNNSTFAPSSLGTSSFGASNASFGQSQNQQQQYVSPESYHTANYRGSQEGHDSYLRADSRQPAQSQFGQGMTGGSFGSFGGNRF